MTPPDLSSYPPGVPPRPGRRRVLKYLVPEPIKSGGHEGTLDGKPFLYGPRGGIHGGKHRFGIRATPKPKVGRFRLFEWSDLGRTRLVCRACRARIKPENQMRHLATELARHGTQEALEALLALRMAQRRGDRHLRGRRYVYALGTSRDWRDRERLEGRVTKPPLIRAIAPASDSKPVTKTVPLTTEMIRG